MTRPQLFIWYAQTVEREFEEELENEEKAWSRTANILAQLENTAMGSKGKGKAKNYMPEFDKNIFSSKEDNTTDREDLIDRANKVGIKPPSN